MKYQKNNEPTCANTQKLFSELRERKSILPLLFSWQIQEPRKENKTNVSYYLRGEYDKRL